MRIPKTADFSGVALTTFKVWDFLSPNARISVKSAKTFTQKIEGSEGLPNLRSLPFAEFRLKEM